MQNHTSSTNETNDITIAESIILIRHLHSNMVLILNQLFPQNTYMFSNWIGSNQNILHFLRLLQGKQAETLWTRLQQVVQVEAKYIKFGYQVLTKLYKLINNAPECIIEHYHRIGGCNMAYFVAQLEEDKLPTLIEWAEQIVTKHEAAQVRSLQYYTPHDRLGEETKNFSIKNENRRPCHISTANRLKVRFSEHQTSATTYSAIPIPAKKKTTTFHPRSLKTKPIVLV
jgi:hypothetical protein